MLANYWVQRPFSQNLFCIFRHKIDATLKFPAIDSNADRIAIADFADRPARQGFGADVPMQAPVDTPEKRPSVRRAMPLPAFEYRRAEVSW